MGGRLFVISGPSGVGLREIVEQIVAGRTDLGAVTPVTARKMKAGEQDGVGFFFYDLDGWQTLKESGDLLETTELAGNDYGTSRHLVEEQLGAGKNVLLNLEPARAAQIKANMPEAIWVYMEPSEAVLRRRLEKISRSRFEIEVRMDMAKRERAMAAGSDFTVNTDDPAFAVAALNRLMDQKDPA